jgi:hypothetical protein
MMMAGFFYRPTANQCVLTRITALRSPVQQVKGRQAMLRFGTKWRKHASKIRKPPQTLKKTRFAAQQSAFLF